MTMRNDRQHVNKQEASAKRDWIKPAVERHDVREDVNGGASFGSDMGGRQKAGS